MENPQDIEMKWSEPEPNTVRIGPVLVGDANSAKQVEEFLAQFDSMSVDDRRAAMASVFGVDPAKAVVVRRADGKLEMQEVSDKSRQQIEIMAHQGFQAASFTNRKIRRQAAALARRKAAPAPASGR